jgi:hypothetical protein
MKDERVMSVVVTVIGSMLDKCDSRQAGMVEVKVQGSVHSFCRDGRIQKSASIRVVTICSGTTDLIEYRLDTQR